MSRGLSLLKNLPTTSTRALSDQARKDVTSPRTPRMPSVPAADGGYPVGAATRLFRIPTGVIPEYLFHGTNSAPPEIVFHQGLQSANKVIIDPEDPQEVAKAASDHVREHVPDDYFEQYHGRNFVSASMDPQAAANFATTNAGGIPPRVDGKVYVINAKKAAEDGRLLVKINNSLYANESEVGFLYEAPTEYIEQVYDVSPDPDNLNKGVFHPDPQPNPKYVGKDEH